MSDLVDVYTVNHLGGKFIADIDQAATAFGGVNVSLLLLTAGGAVITNTQIPGLVNPSTGSPISAGAGGSVSAADPFFDIDSLPIGTYRLAVVPPGTTYDANTGLFTRQINNNLDLGYSPGTYVLHVSSENHAVAANGAGNQSLNFRPGGAAASVSQVETTAFSLVGYAAADLPTLYFNYLLETDGSDRVSMRIVSDANPTGTLIASNLGTANALGEFTNWRQMRIDLGQFAGQSGLRLQVTYDDQGSNFNQEGLYLDDFIIGFAERGELITGAIAGDDSFTFAANPGSVTSGTYQLEMRRGTEYGAPSQVGLALFDAFDTNERLQSSVTLVAPEGDQIQDGDFFELGDGNRTLTFEFNDGTIPGVTVGRIPIAFNAADSASTIAAAIISTINSNQVQGVLKLQAATASGSAANGDSRINIFGNPTGDFTPRVQQQLQITGGGSAAQLASTVAGSDVQVSNAVLTGSQNAVGRFTGGGTILGIESGIVLTNGSLASAQGPNVNDASTGTSTGTGDAGVNTAFGVTTNDSTVLEFDVALAPGATSLFLQMVYASEEYSEDITFALPDIAAVFVDGVAVPVGISSPSGGASAEISTKTYPSSSPFTTINDPISGGDYLAQFGYDGFSAVLRAAATGLAAGTHRVRIVVTDNGADAVDSALFIAAGSLQTTAPVNPRLVANSQGRIVFPAIVSTGVGDQNLVREQGQMIIQHNTFTEIAAYGVWADTATRGADPEDNRTNQFLDNPLLGPSGAGAARNLRALNDDVLGGLAPGAVVANNIFNNAGVAGVQIEGEMAPFIITASGWRDPEPITNVNTPDPVHFGDIISDGLTVTIDANHTRVVFEFEDIAGDPTNAPLPPGGGSGAQGGDGVAPGHVPVYIRHDIGTYLGRAHGYYEMEVMHALRDAIMGSILVTNGIVKLVDPYVGPSLEQPSSEQITSLFGVPAGMTFSHPALYVHGATRVQFSTEFAKVPNAPPFLVQQGTVHEGAQPFARVVNNTIYGTNGNLNLTQAGTGLSEPNDRIAEAVDTRQGVANTPNAYVTTGTIGDGSLAPQQDVDFFSFNLDVGDRVLIDVDTNPASRPVDTNLRLFNSRGEPMLVRNALGNLVESIDNLAAPGETAGNDPYIDFTATEKGTYYVGVAGSGNSTYDPLSLADRTTGRGTGDYQISVETLAPRSFVVSYTAAEQFNDGDTIVIDQIPDFAGTTNNSVTYEIDVGPNGVAQGNIPIPIRANYFPSDVMRAIATAITQTAGVSLPNHEGGRGPNGLSGPISRVEAVALGGSFANVAEPSVAGTVNGQTGAITDYIAGARGVDFNQTAFSHNRGTTTGIGGTTTDGAGTTEQFVWIRNAARVSVAGAPGLRLDPQPNTNTDAVLPQAGVNIIGGASPTLMNNVIINTQVGVYSDVTRVAGYGLPSLRGTDTHPKPGQVIVGGNVFQGVTSNAANTIIDNYRNIVIRGVGPGTMGIEVGPSNINSLQDDFNQTVPNSQTLLVNPEGGNFLPKAGSIIIDSSIDSLLERDAFAAFKQEVGISPSPILAPSLDVYGQLRSDDPTVSSPSGLGGDVFKDRGAVDRADFVGPVAELLSPQDNDSRGIDQDPTLTIVRLPSGVASEIRIRLQDIGDAADPFLGLGIDDSSVAGPDRSSLRRPGAAVTVFENGLLLEEGIDYVFSYDSLTDQIVLTPLAGIFKPNAVYRIELNNRNRFVVQAPAGPQATDQKQLTITDSVGSRVLLEFDTGYQVRLPSDMVLELPIAGGGAGGIQDGDRVTIELPTGGKQTFEFDSNNNTSAGNIRVAFRAVDSQVQVAQAFAAVLTANAVGANKALAEVRVLTDAQGNATGKLLLLPGRDASGQSIAGVMVNVGASPFTLPANALAIAVPSGLAVQDAETFVISDGTNSRRFELDNNSAVGNNNVVVDIRNALTSADVATAIATAITNSGLNAKPTIVAGRIVYLGLPEGGSATAEGAGLTAGLVSRPIRDGQGFNFSDGVTTVRVEFDSNGIRPANAIAIPLSFSDTNAELAVKIEQALANNATLTQFGIAAKAYGSLVSLGGKAAVSFTLDQGTPLESLGSPGVQGNLSLQISGPLLMRVPQVGGVAINDGATFQIVNNGVTVTFEMTVDNILANPLNRGVPYTFSDSPDTIATSISNAIAAASAASALGITPQTRTGGIVVLGTIPATAVTLSPGLPLTVRPGTVSDGERLLLRNGATSVTFEFESNTAGGGVTAGNTQVLFDPNGTPNDVAQTLAAAINASVLGISAVANGATIALADTPQTRVDVQRAPSVQVIGVAGGAIPVRVVNSSLFTAEDVKNALITAVNKARAEGRVDLVATDRGADTFFLEGALALGPELQSFYLRAIQDEAGNFIKPNQQDNSVRFSILLPDAQFDFGDAPDPVNQAAGLYPTKISSNGARHVYSETGPRLGNLLDAETDAQVSVQASGDDSLIAVTATNSTAGRSVFAITVNGKGADLVTTLPAVAAEAEGATIRVNVGGRSVTFEVDSDGQFNENNIRIPFDPSTPDTALAASIRATLLASELSLADVTRTNNTVSLVTDDEDGVVLGVNTAPTTVLSPGNTVIVTVTTKGPGVLSGWIDFNFDGDWSDPGEQVITDQNVPSGVSTQTLTFSLPVGAATPVDPLGALTMARFRVASAGPLQPTGLALDGEVEDYSIRVVDSQGGFAPADDSYTLAEDGSLPIADVRNLLNNDAKRVGGIIQIYSGDTGSRRLANGTINVATDGRFTYTPDAEFFGTETFTYRLVDQKLLSQTGDTLVSKAATVTLTVTPVNDAPRRRDDVAGAGSPYPLQFTVREDENVTFTTAEVLSAFNSDPNDDIVPGPSGAGVVAPFDESGQELRLSVIGSSTTNQGGSVQILSDGTLSYTPPANFFGSDSFRLRVQDNGVPQRTTELNVSVLVVEANDPPAVADRAFNTNEDVQLVVNAATGLLQNATDPDGDSTKLRVTSVNTAGTLGQVTFTSAGAFTYTPPTDYNGLDQFRFVVTDESNATTTRTVTVNVAAVPDAPRATANPLGTLTLVEDGAAGFVDLSQAFFDPDGDALSFVVTSNTPAGRVSTRLSGPLLEVTPLADQFGQALVVVTASDTDPTTPDFAQTLTVSITGSNDAPRVVGAGLPDMNVNEDQTISPINLLQFFQDPDNNPLTFRVVNNTNPGLVTTTINGASFGLTLVPNAKGTAAITVEASDGTQTVTDTFVLSVATVPDAPSAVVDNFAVPRGGILDITVAQDVTRTVTGGSGGRLLTLDSNIGLVPGMLVRGTNNAISSIDNRTGVVTLESAYAGSTITFTGGVLANDSDADGENFTLVGIRVNGGATQPLTAGPFTLTRGSLEFVASAGTFRYLNSSGEIGATDSFQYVIQDSTGLQSVGTVNIRIGSPLLTHHNPLVINGDVGRDVSGDGKLSPVDALLVINLLNRNAGRSAIPVRELPAPPAYYDVTADGFVTTLDALAVINSLNRASRGSGEAGSAILPSSYSTSSVMVGNNIPRSVPVNTQTNSTSKSYSFDASGSNNSSSTVNQIVDALFSSTRQDQDDEGDSYDAVDSIFGAF